MKKFKLSGIWILVALIGFSLVTAGHGNAAAKGKEKFKGTVSVMIKTGQNTNNIGTNYLKKAFEKAYPNVKIDLIVVEDPQYNDKLLTMLAGGAAPDIVLVNNLSMYYKMVAGNSVVALDPFIKAEHYNLNKFDPDIIATIKQYGNDHVYQLPWVYFTPTLIYNKPAFKKYGVPVPKKDITLEGLLQLAKQLQVKIKAAGDDRSDMRPFVTGLMEQNVLHTVSANGSYYYDADKLKMNTNDPAFRKALKFQYDLFREGLAIGPPEAKVKGYQTTDFLFVDNKYPMMLELSWMLKTIMTRAAEKGSSVNPADYGVIPWPHWKDSPDQGSSVLSFNGWAISKDCKDPKLAFEVLKYCVLNFGDNMSKAGVDNLYCRKDAISNRKMVNTFPGLKDILKRKRAPRPKMLLEIDDYIQTKVVRAALELASVSDMTFEQLLDKIGREGQKVIDDYARNKK